jgi:uncharacterized protein (DUF849 family)
MLQAALNGDRTKNDHPAVPLLVAELARDAAACVAAGAGAIHLHPRDEEGRERLEVVDEVVRVVRAACGVPVGVSTGAWIEPDLERRLALVRAWREPEDAIRRELDTRVGFEDTLCLPDRTRATGNAALVSAARALQAP